MLSKNIQNEGMDSRQMLGEFEDSKGVIRIGISQKNRQHNGQKKEYKRTNKYLQNITQKTKDQAPRTPLKTEVTSCALEG